MGKSTRNGAQIEIVVVVDLTNRRKCIECQQLESKAIEANKAQNDSTISTSENSKIHAKDFTFISDAAADVAAAAIVGIA